MFAIRRPRDANTAGLQWLNGAKRYGPARKGLAAGLRTVEHARLERPSDLLIAAVPLVGCQQRAVRTEREASCEL